MSEDLTLPLVALPAAHPCSGCGECCTYIATQIDDPVTFKDYENIHWYLTHENIGVYIDWEGEWYLEFMTRCRNLTEARTCAVYAERPLVCSEFSFTDCEKNSGERGWKHYFKSHEDLLAFMRERRPRAYERYLKKRAQLVRGRTPARGRSTRSASLRARR